MLNSRKKGEYYETDIYNCYYAFNFNIIGYGKRQSKMG